MYSIKIKYRLSSTAISALDAKSQDTQIRRIASSLQISNVPGPAVVMQLTFLICILPAWMHT